VRIGVGLRRLVLGHTLPAGASVASVTLDGTAVAHRERPTNRGLEVLVRAPRVGTHELTVRAAG
jgi:hypothetical protein